MKADRLVRDWQAPPEDVFAEAMVLEGVLLHPETAAGMPLDHFVRAEHRWLLRAMQRAYGGPEQDWGMFYVAWLRELDAALPGRGHELAKLLDVARDYEAWKLADLARWRASQAPGWWWQRLVQVKEARRLIDAAQHIAERAWREDVEGAQQALVEAHQPGAGLRERVFSV